LIKHPTNQTTTPAKQKPHICCTSR